MEPPPLGTAEGLHSREVPRLPCHAECVASHFVVCGFAPGQLEPNLRPPDEGWALMVKSPTAFQLRGDGPLNPHDTASEGRKGWDAVFDGINALEEQNRANELALNSPSKRRRRRSIRGAIKTGGKTWRGFTVGGAPIRIPAS